MGKEVGQMGLWGDFFLVSKGNLNCSANPGLDVTIKVVIMERSTTAGIDH
jgi:hypothetical protein